MTATANQGLILPDGSQNANVPLTFSNYTLGASGIENRLVQRYLSIADRTVRNPTPNEGELSYLIDLNRYEKFDGAAWSSAFGVVIDEQVFTASGTWIKPANAVWTFVEMAGGGGGGGGCTGAGTGAANGGGGGGAGYARRMWASSALGASEAVTVGAGGAGGNVGVGAAGTNSTFNLMAANGGGGGSSGTSTTGSQINTSGAGGTATGGTVNITGSSGDFGVTAGGATVAGGRGGASQLSQMSRPQASAGVKANNGQAYGGGGSGALSNVANAAGGDGAPGIVIVTSYS